eukprot:TRINITY_DN151_c2_g1_i1.p1 TRINITY_DN151_c2_g1~~TRINITY_DN151_c2_g1_i1.p1  ORF type:complete len:171 (-),score=11.52 TRINITY_DN151_c2_g1_i1:1451-1963(-)
MSLSRSRRVSRGYSLIFDMEIEDNGNNDVRPSVEKITKQFFSFSTSAEQQLADLCFQKVQHLEGNSKNWINVEALCRELQDAQYQAWIRSNFHDTNICVYKYVMVSMNNEEYIVDPNYQNEFNAGQIFKTFVDALPSLLIAPRDMALMFVEILIEEKRSQPYPLGEEPIS